MTTTYCTAPCIQVKGTIEVPGDKSISHRSVMLGSIAKGRSEITGFLPGQDCLATIRAMEMMGVQIECIADDHLIVHGVGKHGLQNPAANLDIGNSGTSIRLLSGLLAGAGINASLTGDRSLLKRPMGRVVKPLAEMGASIETQEGGLAPLVLHGGKPLQGFHYEMPVASAQVKSCLLLAGMYAEGETVITEPAPTRDHTERMLQTLGYPISINGPTVSITNEGELTACDLQVPGDISSAAFFLVAACIAEQANVVIRNVGINPTRTGIIHILRLMGANIAIENQRQMGNEPVGDLHIEACQLKGIEIPEEYVPLAIDEFPVIFIAAACAKGKTILRGAEELRVKESDRIGCMAEGLQALGIVAEAQADGIIIEGGKIQNGEVHSHDDHRIAMAFAIAGMHAEVVIHDCENVATSFPNFVQLATELGLCIDITH